MTTRDATPRPWTIDDNGYVKSNGKSVVIEGFTMRLCGDHTEPKANASLICTAVNQHDALVAENDRLREALSKISTLEDEMSDETSWQDMFLIAREFAKAALSGGKGE